MRRGQFNSAIVSIVVDITENVAAVTTATSAKAFAVAVNPLKPSFVIYGYISNVQRHRGLTYHF